MPYKNPEHRRIAARLRNRLNYKLNPEYAANQRARSKKNYKADPAKVIARVLANRAKKRAKAA